MMQKQKMPKDLGVKIGTEKEIFWTRVRDHAKQAVKDAENTIMLQAEVVKLAEIQIQKEKDLNTLKK